MKKICLFISILSLFLITGCYMEGNEIKFGKKPVGPQSTEEIIDYIDNFSECGRVYYGKEN